MDLKPSEKILIGLSLLFLGIAVVGYFGGISFRSYFGIEEEEVMDPVGKLVELEGSMRRQLGNDSEFKEIRDPSVLYNRDTIVTGPTSRAIVEFMDGSRLELEQNTMIRLSFEKDWGLGGITRTGKVEVVNGKISALDLKNLKISKDGNDISDQIGKKKLPSPTPKPTIKPKPSPLPSPYRPSPLPSPYRPPPTKRPSPTPSRFVGVRFITPAANDLLKLPFRAVEDSIQLDLKWEVRPSQPLTMSLSVKEEKGEREVFRQVVAAADGQGQFRTKITEPGRYIWRARDAKGNPLTSRDETFRIFDVATQFTAIDTLPPLVAGQSAKVVGQKKLKEEDYSIRVRWKPYRKAIRYRVDVYADNPKEVSGLKPIISKETNSLDYEFNKGSVFQGVLYYRIRGPLASGFEAVSEFQKLEGSFPPPIQVKPSPDEVISRRSITGSHDVIMLSWKKTNFTYKYELEICLDPEFTTLYRRETVPGTFFLLEVPPPGRYFWRIRSVGKSAKSEWSEIRQFKMAE